MKNLSLNFIALVVLIVLFGCNQIGQSGFVDEDLTNMKKAIKIEFEKTEGITVTDVQLIIESPKKVTGFVKLSDGVSEVMKNCSATYGSNNQYIWQCN